MKKLLVVATALALGFAYGEESKTIDELVVTNGGPQYKVEKKRVALKRVSFKAADGVNTITQTVDENNNVMSTESTCVHVVEKCKAEPSKTVSAKPPVTAAKKPVAKTAAAENKPLKSCCCGGSADAKKVPLKFTPYQKGSTPYIQKKLSKEEVAERVAKMRKERDEKFSKIRESREEVKKAIRRGKKVSEKKESK